MTLPKESSANYPPSEPYLFIPYHLIIAMTEIKGYSYESRVQEVNDIYDRHCRSGLSNREILRRYIWPKYKISEKTFYNYISATINPRVTRRVDDT